MYPEVTGSVSDIDQQHKVAGQWSAKIIYVNRDSRDVDLIVVYGERTTTRERWAVSRSWLSTVRGPVGENSTDDAGAHPPGRSVCDGVRAWVDDRGVGRLTICRSDRMNALDTAACVAITQTLGRWAADDAVGVVVFDGAEGSFCSGADVTSIAQGRGEGGGLSSDQAYRIISAGSELARAIRAIRVPVIASVDGVAAGIGASLALSADLIYATARSYFLLAFINIGLMPDGGSSMLVSAAVGRARANAMALLGERLYAPAASDAGLITAVVDDRAALDVTVDRVAATLASTSPAALRLTKAALDAQTMRGFDEALARELEGQRTLLQSPEFSEALAAFTDRRP